MAVHHFIDDEAQVDEEEDDEDEEEDKEEDIGVLTYLSIALWFNDLDRHTQTSSMMMRCCKANPSASKPGDNMKMEKTKWNNSLTTSCIVPLICNGITHSPQTFCTL